MIHAICPNPSMDTVLELDSFSAGKSNRIRKQVSYPGGKGVHVALAVAELGKPGCLSGIFAGQSGDWIRKQCESRDIVCSGLSVDGNTRSCFTLKVPGDVDETEILEPGPHITLDQMGHFIFAAAKNSIEATVVALCGSWPQGAPSNAGKALVKAIPGYREKVIVDASGDSLREIMPLKPFCIHVNFSECRNLFPHITSPSEGSRVLAQHCSLAVVTNGAQGAWAAFHGENIHVSCPVENVITSVGCGDCLVAGLACARASGNCWRDIVVSGVACGAANCLREDLGMLYRSDVDRLLSTVSIKEIS